MQTNMQFAKKVGVHFTMASRLRNGQRRPSAQLLFRIAREYHLPLQEMASAYTAGPDELGLYLRTHIFDAPD